jgi:transposase
MKAQVTASKLLPSRPPTANHWHTYGSTGTDARSAACSGCGVGLADAAVVAVRRRQVFEIPQVTARVVEHHLVTRRCRCAVVTCAQAPAGMDASVQYGPRLTAVVVYLLVAQFGAQKRVAQAVADLFGCRFRRSMSLR